jgi:hypothetical protein
VRSLPPVERSLLLGAQGDSGRTERGFKKLEAQVKLRQRLVELLEEETSIQEEREKEEDSSPCFQNSMAGERKGSVEARRKRAAVPKREE